ELWQQASLLELTHDAIFVFVFPTGPILYWNRGAEMLYGYAKAEAVGRSPRELLHTFHPRGVDSVATALEENGSWAGELIHTARDGRAVYVDSRGGRPRVRRPPRRSRDQSRRDRAPPRGAAPGGQGRRQRDSRRAANVERRGAEAG